VIWFAQAQTGCCIYLVHAALFNANYNEEEFKKNLAKISKRNHL